MDLPIIEARVFRGEDETHWVANIVLADPQDYARFAQDDEFVLEIYGDQYALIVDSKELRRPEPGVIQLTINAVSPTARADFPRADPYTVLYETSVYARDAVEAALGTVIDWQMVNWIIPPYRLSAENASPLQFARTIVEAAGGVLESKRDGTFLARHRFPVSTLNYETTAPDHVFLEIDKIASVTEQFVPGKIVNRIRITDTDANFADRIEFVPNENDAQGLSGELRVYPSPWRSTLRLLQTSPAQVVTLTVANPWERTRLVTENDEGLVGELIEIVNGEGNTHYPIDSIENVEWLSVPLGPVTFEPNSTTVRSTLPEEGYGLMRLTYYTRYLSYNAVSTEPLPAQFILEDIG